MRRSNLQTKVKGERRTGVGQTHQTRPAKIVRVAVTARGNPNVRVDHSRDSALPESNNQNLRNLLRVIRVIRGSFVVRQEKAIHESHELHELHEVDFEDSGTC